MTNAIKLLDHGYVKFIEAWGSDSSIIEAARMSTNKGFQGWGPRHKPECARGKALASSPFQEPFNESDVTVACDCSHDVPGDEKLLKFLWDNKHATPFEMAGMVIEVQAPIMVFREWHRHRTQSYNEMSARYTQLPETFYVPEPERIKAQSKTNKQATGTDELHPATVAGFRDELIDMQKRAYTSYELAIKAGIPRELARLHLPVSIYSRMRAQALLRNWLSFLSLRLDVGAQWEIRKYAEAVSVLIEERFPRTFALFNAGRVK